MNDAGNDNAHLSMTRQSMFDFEKELTVLQQRDAEAKAAKQAAEDRQTEIGLELARNAKAFRDHYGRPFDVQIVKSKVEIVSPDGRALTITIKPDDLFDITGGAQDVNSRGWQNKRDVTESEVTQAIINWTAYL